MSMEPLDEIDQFPGGDESEGMLVDSNMIPTAATEVVMSGDGIERDFEGGGNEEESYQYEYTYEEDQEGEHHPHHLQMEDEEVVVTEEEYPASWKNQQHKKMDLYNMLSPHNKMYLEEKPAKRARLDDARFYQQSAQGAGAAGGPPGEYNFPPGEVEEYREYTVYNKQQQMADRVCEGCQMTLRRSVYYHHARMIREKGACNLFTPQRFPCTRCDARIGTLEKLCQHMEQIHNAPTQIKTAFFTDEEAFAQFRIELEGKGGNFRMARGNKKNKKGTVQYFRCNRLQTLARQHTFRPVDNPSIDALPTNRKLGRLQQPKDIRAPSAKQVIRTENSCTAFYNKAYIGNGTIEVRYCDYHLHDDEKLRLPDAVRKRVIELSRKNLPHVVILMIVKDERLNYCEKNSANDRRIQEMKTQDIRQVLAGNNRAQRTKAQRAQQAGEIYGKADSSHESHDITLGNDEVDMTRTWNDVRPAQKIDRHSLSQQELRYLDLFEHNREEIMAKLNEKTRAEQDKKMLYDSFIHRLSSAQDMVKHLHFRQLIPTESTLAKLKKTYNYLSKIEDLLLNPRRETTTQTRFVSYLRMLEEESRLDEERNEVAGSSGGGGGAMEEIDVVGIDEDDYLRHHHHHHDHHHDEIVEEEEVGYHHHEEIGEDGYLSTRIVAVEEIPMEEEEEVEREVLMEEVGEEGVGQEDSQEQDGEPGEATVTRAGRIVKKKTLYDS